MKPIRLGDRGPAVEDVQRRLRALGYDLGPTGVDGVFFGRTAEAVTAFQAAMRLGEDGLVGDETWSALVDETFTLGDRMLYLRLPHFHGRDVRVLQQALNALGFACGRTDSIFGAFTERALAEFQENAGLIADGIAGQDTVRAIVSLRHVWEGKDTRAHSQARVAAARAAEVLAKVPFRVGGSDSAGRAVAERIVNLARATTPQAATDMIDGATSGESVKFSAMLCAYGTAPASPGRPVVRMATVDTLAARLLTALESAPDDSPAIVVELEESTGSDEHDLQRAAVRFLDAVCRLFD